MSPTHGQFVWYELMTNDVAAAQTFYGKAVGWGAQDSGVAGVAYTLFTVAGVPVTGLMDLPRDARTAGVPPCWIGYVGVDDVDASLAQATALGATVHCPPTDIPTVGRFAAIADPQGATIALFKWLNPGQNQPAPPGTAGHVGWRELMTTDWQAAFPFYETMFGWKKAEAVDIGAMGIYQLFSTGEHPVGGMFNKLPMVPVPAWLYYVNVGDVGAAVVRVAEAGGQTVNGPMQVPGGSWIAQCRDPQGAMFALVGSKA
jgi:predicted enzyme related to lactoylglutathione lyase